MATLKIYAPIVDDEDRVIMEYLGLDGVSFKSVDDFIAGIPDDDNEIDIRLHCPGGSVFEGWAIHDRLRATGKHISATIEGNCASMASILLLAASDRRANPHATLLIHDPFVSLYDSYTADELRKLYGDLAAQRDRILDYYVERTGADRKTLDRMMRDETIMDMDTAQELGFITEIVAPLSASANLRYMAKSNKKNFMQRLIGAITDVIDGEGAFTAYTLNTAAGGQITLEKEAGDPAVGDKATPDGEHLMPDGKTFVISDGVITEIRPAESNAGEDADNGTGVTGAQDTDTNPNPDGNPAPEPTPNPEPVATAEDVAAMRAQIEALTAQVAALTEERDAAVADADEMRPRVKTALEMDVLNLVTIAGGSLEGGRKWVAEARSNYKPADRAATRTAVPAAGTADTDAISRQLAEAKARNGIKNAGNDGNDGGNE